MRHYAPYRPSGPQEAVELFAGVGGFRLGLEGEPGTPGHRRDWRVVWSNQWEPSTKREDASDCYVANFGSEGHSAVDIAQALDWRLDKKPASREELASVPRLPQRMALLVGGFPCQDYSVAKSLYQSSGIMGQKGVLWWEIRRFLAARTKGQLQEGTFRLAVRDAYAGACAVTGEHSSPALEAAHIVPYRDGGPHRIDNGLLLRSDVHRLFDRGYVTVTPDLQFRVGERLRDEFSNGRSYYPLSGSRIAVPENAEWQPDRERLAWHGEVVFKG